MKAWMSGNVAGTGTFRCTECDSPVSLDAVDELPACPNCGGTEFVRSSLFTTSQQPVLDLGPDLEDQSWLAELRAGIDEAGQYVAYRVGEDVLAYALEREWTRIGRSLAADIRFDDPTVSRRHALIVRQPDGLRVLDDRSLNGVFVNGERVEWSTLADGDEVVIGRHHLHFVDIPAISGMRSGVQTRARTARRSPTEAVPAPGRRPTPPARRQLAYSAAPMPSTIAVLSQKGGTGKTTTVRTLTDVFRRAGLAVLAVDLDPQGNLSDYLDVPPDADPTVGDVLTGRAKAAAAVHNGVIPANLGLAEAELALGGKMGRELTLKRAIREVSADYDLVLIDCPPALGLLTVNALVASDYALLSAEAQYFALQGVEQALEVIELAKDSLNPDLEWLGVVLNIADMRTRHSREAFDSLREHFGDKLLDTTIRASIAYAESAERALSILDYRPDLGADYLLVADELLRRLGLKAARKQLAPLLRSSQARFGPPRAL